MMVKKEKIYCLLTKNVENAGTQNSVVLLKNGYAKFLVKNNKAIILQYRTDEKRMQEISNIFQNNETIFKIKSVKTLSLELAQCNDVSKIEKLIFGKKAIKSNKISINYHQEVKEAGTYKMDIIINNKIVQVIDVNIN